MTSDEAGATVRRLIESQRQYYELRAPDHGDPSRPPDRKEPGLLGSDEARRVVEEFGASGDVLELACGSGAFTRELARHADSLTAVDGSPRMLELNEHALGDAEVDYVCADLFHWQPPCQFDAVFFGFWLSHVPPTHWASFWSMVRSCLRPGGRVGFVDEDDRAVGNEASYSATGIPTSRRTLADGRSFDIIKVFWSPRDLERRLHALGWRARVRSFGRTFLFGVAERDQPAKGAS
jgi:demethylmenaquinone methyltransferase/2-methoxy-6-polyprenyl-1,4-benzoquinol methylase